MTCLPPPGSTWQPRRMPSHALPFETFLLAMLLEEHKELLRLREELDAMQRRLRLRMAEHTGWLLDVYDDRRAGAALWLLGDDGT